ncbi:MAG: A24 family peptidase [Planctomycetaceae bacterium]|nr:A24 family peptidase [Planctomycetaceae bacterium]
MMWTTLWVQGNASAQWAVVIVASAVGAACDVKSRRLPNALTAPLLAGALAWSAWTAGWSGLGDSLCACALMALPYLLLFYRGGGGGGDVKMMGALGAWLGLVNAMVALAAVALAGVAIGVAYALRKRALRQVTARVAVMAAEFALSPPAAGPAQDLTEAAQGAVLKMPYGLAIFTGVLAAAGAVALYRAS